MKIKDPIHGYIELDKEEEKLVDLPCIQRLRYIQQLGLSSLVYPGANHSRFEHTLGVMHLTRKYSESLELDSKRTKELRIAALFHDSGHGPWSHLSEKALDFDHEEESCKIAREHEDKYSVDSKRVCKIIKGEIEIAKVLHGEVDADRLDYLQRDAYKTGVEHGMIDSGTIIENAEIDSRRLVYNHKATQALESLLVARKHMIKSVYQHHTAKIADRMMIEAIKQTIGDIEFNRLDEYQADRLLNGNKYYDKVMKRQLFKRAGEFGVEKDITKEKLVKEAGVEKDEILIDEGVEKENPKRESESLDIAVKEEGQVKPLGSYSNISAAVFESLVGDNYRIYAEPDKAEKVKQAREKIINT